MRHEYSERKLFFGKTLRPANSPTRRRPEGHHVALPLDGPQLQGQRRSRGVAGRDHLRARQPASWMAPSRFSRTRSGTNRNRPPQAVVNRRGASEKPRDIGDRLDRRPRTRRALVVQAPGSGAKPSAFRTSRTAVGLSGCCCSLRAFADLVDGVILLAQIDDQIPRGRLLRPRSRAVSWRDKEDGIHLATEVVAQDVERGHRVAEGAGDLWGGQRLDEVGAQRLVLALLRRLRVEEEPANVAYVFRCSVLHDATVSPTASGVKPGLRTRRRVASDPLPEQRLLRTRWLGSMRTRLLCIAVRLFLSDDHYGKHQRGTENRRDGSGGGNQRLTQAYRPDQSGPD